MGLHSKLLKVAAAIAAMAISAQAHAETPPPYVTTFGTCGSGPGQFMGLWGIAAGPDGSVYVVDAQAQRVNKFDNNGVYVTRWPVAHAWDVAVAPDGSLFVLRKDDARIEHFTDTGVSLGEFGAAGSADGQMSGPYGIAVDLHGHVLVADAGNHRIQKFALDGTFLGKWGVAGGQIGQLQFPTKVAVDALGDVFVTDQGNGRIYRFNESGALTTWWYLGGPFNMPLAINYGLAVEPGGNVYVVIANDRIDKYTASGAFLARWGGDGSGPGEYYNALTVALDAANNVFVTDGSLCKVTKYGKEPPVPSRPITWGAIKAVYR